MYWGSWIGIPARGLSKANDSLTTSAGVWNSPPFFPAESANILTRCSEAVPSRSGRSKSSLRSRWRLKWERRSRSFRPGSLFLMLNSMEASAPSSVALCSSTTSVALFGSAPMPCFRSFRFSHRVLRDEEGVGALLLVLRQPFRVGLGPALAQIVGIGRRPSHALLESVRQVLKEQHSEYVVLELGGIHVSPGDVSRLPKEGFELWESETVCHVLVIRREALRGAPISSTASSSVPEQRVGRSRTAFAK